MSLKDVVRAIRAGWWIVVLVAVLGAAAALGLSLASAKQYQSTVEFFVRTPTSTAQGANAANQFATQRVNSYVKLLDSSTFAQDVIDNSGLNLSSRAVSRTIVGSADINTVLLTATITDTDRQRSYRIAQAVANRFPTVVESLENDNGQSDNEVRLTVVSGPTLHEGAVSPKTKLNTAVGLILGLAIGVAVAVLRRLLDTTVRTSAVLRNEFDRPVVATIHFDSVARTKPLIVEDQSRSIRAESFRQLRTNLRFSDVDNPIKAILVTSSVASEGKSATSTNLALVFAEAGSSVLLIEADLRRPRVTEYLGLEREVGLTNVLAGQIDLDDALQPWGTSGMHVLPSGSIPPNPSELLGSQNMADLMTRLRARFDMIVIDTPPLLPVTDAAVAARLCDGVVLVVRHGRTSRANVATSVASLEAVDARVLGFVLNMVPRRDTGKSAYDGYGYYEDSDGSGRPGRRRKSKDAPEPAPLLLPGLADVEPARAPRPGPAGADEPSTVWAKSDRRPVDDHPDPARDASAPQAAAPLTPEDTPAPYTAAPLDAIPDGSGADTPVDDGTASTAGAPEHTEGGSPARGLRGGPRPRRTPPSAPPRSPVAGQRRR